MVNYTFLQIKKKKINRKINPPESSTKQLNTGLPKIKLVPTRDKTEI